MRIERIVQLTGERRPQGGQAQWTPEIRVLGVPAGVALYMDSRKQRGVVADVLVIPRELAKAIGEAARRAEESGK